LRKTAPALASRARACSAAKVASLLVLCLALALLTHPAGATEVASCGFTSGALRDKVGSSGRRVGAMQRGLAAVFSGRPAFDRDVSSGQLRDQRLGPRTRRWVGTFCDEFKPAGINDRIAAVEAALNHYAAIAMAHEDWRDTVRGSALATWLQASAPITERRLRLSGPAADVIDLLDAFARLPRKVHDLGDAVTGYQEIEAAHPDWRQILVSASFSHWIEADVRGLRALRRSGSAPIVIGLLDEYAAARLPIDACSVTLPDDKPEDAVYYRLQPSDMANLAARAQPALQAVVSHTFNKKSDLVEAVGKALPALAATCPPEVFATIVTGPSDEGVIGTMLDAGSVDLLTKRNTPAKLLAAVAILEGRVFETRGDLAEAVRFRIDEALLAASAEEAARPAAQAASLEPGAVMATPVPLSLRSDATAAPTARPVAAGESETEQAGRRSGRRDDRPEGHRFDARVESGRGGYGCPNCTAVTPEQLNSIIEAAVPVYGLSAARAAQLMWTVDALPALAPIPEDRLGALRTLQGVAFVNRRLFLRAVAARFGIADPPTTADSTQLSAVAAAARKQEPSPYPPVTITGESCGCLRNFSGTIYGFLPPWLGVDEASAADAADTDHRAASASTFPVDFTVMSRVGYLGLTLQTNGEPAADRQWQPSFDLGGLIATAHKHGTRVDLVVRAAGWQAWTDTAVQDVAIGQIVSRITREIKPAATSVTDLLALFDRFLPTRLDGVSLFFESYDGSDKQSTIIDRVVTKLRARLDAEDRPYVVNLVFDIDLSSEMLEQLRSILRPAPRPTPSGSFAESFRQPVMPGANVGKSQVDLVLSFLEQPSSQAKKRLRVELDESNAFHGQERKDLLRRIVPVISPDGHLQPLEEKHDADSFQQLDDDLIYFEDNFAGVGFWPLPKRISVDHERLRGLLLQRYATDLDGGFLPPSSDTALAMQVCDFACPNRWLFRVALDAAGGLLLLAGGGAALNCGLRNIFRRYGLAILTLAIVLAVCC
jgi:hypothetical protein